MKNSGLATRLIIFILTSTAIIFVAVLTYNYYSAKATIMADAVEDAKNLALATGNKIEINLNGGEKIPPGGGRHKGGAPPQGESPVAPNNRALGKYPGWGGSFPMIPAT